MDIQYWINIAIATSTIDDMSQDADRWKRLRKVLPVKTFQPEDLSLLRSFGQACSAWAQVCSILDEHINDILLHELREVYPLEYKDPNFANILVQQFLFKADARLTSKTDIKKGVVLDISAHGFHELTTAPWYRYQLQPRYIQRCHHCGFGYINERATKFCSSTCRVGSFKEKRKAHESSNLL